jgi:hypothetical protein
MIVLAMSVKKHYLVKQTYGSFSMLPNELVKDMHVFTFNLNLNFN